MTSWFRSWHGAPTDPKWLMIAKRAKVPPGIVCAVAWALYDHASQANDRGDISEFCTETFAAFSEFTEDEIKNVMDAFRGPNGIITDNRLKRWEKRQPKREDNSAERVKRYREKERGVTQGNAEKRTVTHTEIEQIQRKKEPTVPKKVTARGSRLPDDWQPNSETTAWCLNELGWRLYQIDSVIQTFRDYWHSESGQRASKLDWDKTFKNWCRREGKQKSNGKIGWGETLQGMIDDENRNPEMGDALAVVSTLPVAERH